MIQYTVQYAFTSVFINIVLQEKHKKQTWAKRVT